MKAPRIHIAYFTNTRGRAGVEEHILTLLRGIDRELFRPYLICPPALADVMRPDLPPDTELFELDLSSPANLGAAWRLARFLRSRRIQILHCHMFQSSLAAAPVARFGGVRVVVETAHGREDWRRGWKARFEVDRAIARLVTAYIAVSEGCGEYLKQEKRLPSRKIAVIANGCDLARFGAPSQSSAALRAELGIEGDAQVLVVVGRLEPQKGHRILLEAFRQVCASFPKVRLICVGDGSLRADLESQAQASGISGSVRFAGYRKNTEDWLALADAVVLPSFYEGMPLVAIEALAAGRAMIATDVDGTREVIVHGKTGLLAPAGQPAPLADAICRLLGDPRERHTLAEAGKRWVMEHFTERRQIEKTQDLYLRLLRNRVSLAGSEARQGLQEPAKV